jgi:hypothetical protein
VVAVAGVAGGTEGAAEEAADAMTVAAQDEGTRVGLRRARVAVWEVWAAGLDGAGNSRDQAAHLPSPPGEGCRVRAVGGAVAMDRPVRAGACPVASPGASDVW